MEAAQESVKNFMSKSGHHQTHYHETHAEAVQNETVVAKQHEEHTTALQREIHQDHYHTTVQPVHHHEVLPEIHHHNLKEVEHRSFEHDDKEKVKSRLAQEQSQFQHTSQRVDGERTTAHAPIVTGEHVHHHVYETVQPVIYKQTIEPHIIHTTIPIHEVHHTAAQHHEATTLPAMTMEDFMKGVKDRKARHEKFDGCPPDHSLRGLDGHCQHPFPRDTRNGVETTSKRSSTSSSRSSTPIYDAMTSSTSSLNNEQTTAANGTATSTPRTSTSSGRADSPIGSPKGSLKGKSQKKPSLLARINPRKDANGDGKAGFMS